MTDWLTTTEASQLSGYTPKHIRRLVTAGKIKGQRWGRDWQVDRRSLLTYMNLIEKQGEKRGPKPS